jgi:hypothetical protein
MKRAIVIKGQSDSGKTTVLNNLYSWISNTQALVIHKAWNKGDIHAEFNIGQLYVSFNSCGDEGDYVDKYLKDCIGKGFDLIICACRGKGATNQGVKKQPKISPFCNRLCEYIPCWIRAGHNLLQPMAK